MAETLGDRIRMHRARLHMTQTQLAERIGVSLTTISAIETGQTDPRVSRIAAIADALGVSVDYLLGRRESWSEFLPTMQQLVPA